MAASSKHSVLCGIFFLFLTVLQANPVKIPIIIEHFCFYGQKIGEIVALIRLNCRF
jgi:hypothetical protein